MCVMCRVKFVWCDVWIVYCIASHYAWGTYKVCECKIDVKSTWIPTWHWMDHVTWSLGLFSKTTLEVGLTQNRESITLRMFTIIDSFYFYHVWGPAWIKIHWDSSLLRAHSHMTSHYTWGSVTTLHDFGGVLGRWPLDTFFWAHPISWSWLMSSLVNFLGIIRSQLLSFTKWIFHPNFNHPWQYFITSC